MGWRAGDRARPGAARRYRVRQDVHHGQADREGAAPDFNPGTQQDVGGAALRRDEGVFPGQRRRVFR